MYGPDVDNGDFWVAGLAERRVDGNSNMGETLSRPAPRSTPGPEEQIAHRRGALRTLVRWTDAEERLCAVASGTPSPLPIPPRIGGVPGGGAPRSQSG